MTDTILEREGNGFRFCVMKDLNGCVVEGMRDDISGAFGVLGEMRAKGEW